MNFQNLTGIFLATITGLSLLAMLLPLALRIWVHIRVRSRIYALGQGIPSTDAAVVLGAGLWSDGSPTPVLYDRVITGVALYMSGCTEFLLMSGDGRFDSYNEPEAMRTLAIQLGVPEEKITVDYAGLRTYESLRRAQNIHNLQRVAIVTQEFHLDRAMYLADAIGLNAIGVTADRRQYRYWPLQRGRLRELIATVKAWFDIHLSHRIVKQSDDPVENIST